MESVAVTKVAIHLQQLPQRWMGEKSLYQ